jgi:hypothetical protein
MSERDVAAAVETWLQGVIADTRPDAAVEEMEPYVVDGETVAYIVHLVGGGFCLAGADDLVLPVYFYSPHGTYDPDSPGHAYILWEIGTRLTGLRQSLATGDPGLEPYREALAERALRWGDLASRRIPMRGAVAGDRSEPDMMVLPFTPLWGQGSPYNDECPVLPGPPYEPPPNEGHSKVGCVATAMTQIMYYWKWPETGTGTRSVWWSHFYFDEWETATLETDPQISAATWAGRLDWTDAFTPPVLRMGGYWDPTIYDKATEISIDPEYRAALAALWSRALVGLTMWDADFGATTYDWDLMQDEHTDADGPDAGDAEVAKLSYHAGVSVSMNWGRYSSGAQTSDVALALSRNFRYDPDAHYWTRDTNMMTANILWLRPLQLKGKDANGRGSHAWVVYGYDKSTDPNRRFMMNMGWSGDGDGWYSCDSITPKDWEFNLDQAHVTQIAPEGVVKFVGSVIAGDGSPNEPYKDLGTALDYAPDGATLIFKAGSDNTFAGGSLVIERPFKLKGYDVRILHE